MNKLAENFLTIIKQTMIAHGFEPDVFLLYGEVYVRQWDYFGDLRSDAVTGVLDKDWKSHNPLPGVGAHRRLTEISADPDPELWVELLTLAGIPPDEKHIKVFFDKSGTGIRAKYGIDDKRKMIQIATWREFMEARQAVFGE